MRISGIAVLIGVLAAILPLKAADTIPEIRVSLLDVAPGPAVYAAAGHAALRLECPSAGLDYVFSYEMTLGLDQLAKFALGKANGGYLAAPTADYLAQYAEEQRAVTERQVNLTPRQKQALWEWLDSEIVKQMPYRYDYAHNMCSTMAIAAIEHTLGGERIDWGTLPQEVTATSRTAMRFGMRHVPWARLFWDTILGTEGDRTPTPQENMCPELLELSLRQARIITADGAARPFFVAPAAVLRQGVEKPACGFTPWVCFALVLAVALLLSLLPAGRLVRLLRLLRLVYDLLLFGLSGLLGLMLIWMICFSQLVGTDWNWLILPFCPLLPLAALLITRRCRRCGKRLWLAETCITALCIPLALVIPQYSSPYILIFLAMAVRSYCRYKHLKTK